MAEALKDMFSPEFYEKLSDILKQHVKGFDPDLFKLKIFDTEWDNRELKARMRHTSLVLHDFFPQQYLEAVDLFYCILPDLKREKISKYGFEFMLFPDYIEVFGLEHYKASVKAMEFATTFASCEFAVRPYIIKFGNKMMDQMLKWSLNEHPRVRRLSSEGCRPRLPWAMAIPDLKKDPGPILPILENLKDDSDEWVRKSVSNNINDISKDHPEVVLELITKWQGGGPSRDKILKHGARTLLKGGNPEALALFGYVAPETIKIENFSLRKPVVRIGEDQHFSFDIVNSGSEKIHLRLEYAVYYMKSNNKLSKKVFKISEKDYPANSKTPVKRKQHFRQITTRRYYAGKHAIALILNGHEQERFEFDIASI